MSAALLVLPERGKIRSLHVFEQAEKHVRVSGGRTGPMSQHFTFKVDGRGRGAEVEPDQPLLYTLRDDLGLKAPHFGCGLAQCGACTVLVDGQPEIGRAHV